LKAEELAEKVGWKLVNDLEEMFARADIIWSHLDRCMRQAEEAAEDPEAAAAAREFMGRMYEALLDNMYAVREAVVGDK
jgi:hypothetical protein